MKILINFEKPRDNPGNYVLRIEKPKYNSEKSFAECRVENEMKKKLIRDKKEKIKKKK